MIPLAADEVATVVGGELVVPSGQSLPIVSGVARIDSRDLHPGDLFVAILGENVDGHDFIDQALEAGAVLSLVTRPVAGAYVLVADVVEALTELARHNAQRLPDTCTVIGLTGSSGKTSTKDLLASILETHGATIAPPGSFNNEIGMPLTVLRADASTRYLVLEMGARGVGHVAWLCSIARPDVGLELNVGSAHLSEFGDAATIALAKGELVEALPPTGIAVLNGDDALVRGMAPRTQAQVVYFGDAPDSTCRATDVALDDLGRASFTLHAAGQPDVDVSLQVSGRHQVSNALAAAAAAISLGLTSGQVARALGTASARSPWRMAVSVGAHGTTVINDAYNANPESMAAALQATADIAGARRIGLVLGEMRELGSSSGQAHRDVGAGAARIGASWVVVAGPVASDVAAGIESVSGESAGGESVQVVHVADADEAIDASRSLVREGDVILVKASRAIGLEAVAQALLEPAVSTGSTVAEGGAA